MPRVLPAIALLLLAACQQEPTFDERYEAAQKKVGTTAAGIEAEMRQADQRALADQRQREAAEAAARQQAGSGT